jgi:hypothetical protein
MSNKGRFCPKGGVRVVVHYPTYRELLDACAKYVKLEQGDTNYEVVYAWVNQHWGDPIRVAGGIRILEETWNRAFYSRGIFDMNELMQVLVQNESQLTQLRLRHIETFSSPDEEVTRDLWQAFFTALKPRGRPVGPYVATAKALHLLVPSFFVPFDRAIAKNYGCSGSQPEGYVRFQHLMAELACYVLDSYVSEKGGDRQSARAMICGPLYSQKTGSHYSKTLAKLLDEYNWVTRF